MAKVEKTLEVRRILQQRRPRRVEFLAADVQLDNACPCRAVVQAVPWALIFFRHGAARVAGLNAFAATTRS